MTPTLDLQATLATHLDRFILDHAAGLRFTRPEDLPESPIAWMLDRFHEGMDACYLLATLQGLHHNGATPADCARYATDQTLDLPFLGTERAVFDVVIESMRQRGIEPMQIAQVIELMGLGLEAMRRLMGAVPLHGVAHA